VKYLTSLILISLSGCYSFKGISISPEINTFYVSAFQNVAANAPAGIEIQFTDGLIQRINNNSKLNYSDTDPDIEFDGSISSFRVSAVAPQQSGEQATTAFNRLTISAKINHINNINEDENWSQTFSFFEDFDSNTDLSGIQDDLIERIFEQMINDIFNKAFTNW